MLRLYRIIRLRLYPLKPDLGNASVGKTVFLFSKHNMKIAIILNGNFYNFKPHLDKDDFIIAADGGANHCHQLKIKPRLIIGDLDSITKETQDYFFDVPQTKITDQETTDLEKVINYIKKNLDQKEKIELIRIFCASSLQRVDHFMANLFLIGRFIKWPVDVIDERFIIKYLSQDTIIKNLKKKTVSIYPVDHCVGLGLIGFQWPLNHKKYSISNIIQSDQAEIKIVKGKVILIINK